MKHQQSPTILMCPPDFFRIEYEINPWMNKTEQNDHAASASQWNALKKLLISWGCRIEEVKPVLGLPDLVFTANAGLIYGNRVFLSQFRHAARQGEEAIFKKWFQDHNFEVIELPTGMAFEGAGDALFCGKTLFAGYIYRSDATALQWIADQIGQRVIPLQLTSEQFYHLDTCFCPLDEDTAIYYPAAFDEYAQIALTGNIHNLIAVSQEEAARFACNAVVVGKQVVLNTGCPKLEMTLNELGYETFATCLDEFLKSGGSAKCLTLNLER